MPDPRDTSQSTRRFHKIPFANSSVSFASINDSDDDFFLATRRSPKHFFLPSEDPDFPWNSKPVAVGEYLFRKDLCRADCDLMVCKIDRLHLFGGGIFYSAAAGRPFFSHRKAYLACTWVRCKCSKVTREWLSSPPKVPISRGEKECD